MRVFTPPARRDFVIKPAPWVQGSDPAPVLFRPELPATECTLLGLDIGKTRDPSALTVVQASEWETPGGAWVEKRYACVGAKRWPLQTEYPDVVQGVKDLLPRFQNPILVVDASGVGRPIVDYLARMHLGCPLIPVVMVGGTNARYDRVGRVWHVSKYALVSGAQLLLQSGRLEFPAKRNGEMDALLAELATYSVKVSKSGRETYNAREGEHDDLVMGLCCALWWGSQKGRRFNVR